MAKHRGAFGRADLVALLTVPVILAGLVAAALADAGSTAKQNKSARMLNRIAVGQQNYATSLNQKGMPEEFVRGTEGFCRPGGKALENHRQYTDASRAFVFLVKDGFVDSLADFASPADPFVAVLHAKPQDLKDVFDFPAEGKALGKGAWAEADSPAAKEDGHTFYSYSMQSGSRDVQCNVGVKMLARLPLVADRNPYGAVFKELAKEEVTKNSEGGNPWNNNRGTVIYSERDGSVRYLQRANIFEMPLTAGPRAPQGFDYIYGDEAVAEQAPKPAGANVKPGEAGQSKTPWGSWLID